MAKLLGAVEEHGEERVRPALEAALAGKRLGLLDVIVRTPEACAPITVPKALADFVIEAGKAADYDHLLLTDGGSHE